MNKTNIKNQITNMLYQKVEILLPKNDLIGTYMKVQSIL